MLDALDFFTASLTVTELAAEFHRANSEITWGITLVLMLRSAGAILFGLCSDRFGRKWPFVANLVLFSVLELGTGFCRTYSQFLACRALFGIAMGGIYGNAAAMALEDVPLEARGLMSGAYQAGYPIGYLFTTVFSRALVNTTPQTWRSLFWFTAGLPIPVIIWRLLLPETMAYRERELMRASATATTASFFKEGAYAIKNHWLTLTYLVLLMAGCNYMASPLPLYIL
jgi:SHS family lactate transporter-like MFS transporter